MKTTLMGIVICLAVMGFTTGLVWSQDTASPAGQPASVQMDVSTAGEQDADSIITIEDAVVCQDVVDRAPVGSSDLFVSETPKIFCFCRVVGAQPGTEIIHNWYYKGSLKASVKLNVHSSNYRTWSSKTLLPQWQGEWMVEILSQEGKPLESIIFMVK